MGLDDFEKLSKDKKFMQTMNTVNEWIPKLIIIALIWIAVVAYLVWNLESFSINWLYKFVLLMIGLFLLRKTVF